jgi:hypothetical protein
MGRRGSLFQLYQQVTFVYSCLANRLGAFGNFITSQSEADGSRREESNTPSTDYDSVALTLSYTGEFVAGNVSLVEILL